MSIHASSAKPYKGSGMEGAVAKWYASLTKKSLEDFKALARRIEEQIPPNSNVLEVAPGPGYCAIELAKLGNYEIVGLDISKTLLRLPAKMLRKQGCEWTFAEVTSPTCPLATRLLILFSVALRSRISLNRSVPSKRCFAC